MGDWPCIDFGHTGVAAAFGRADVYAIRPGSQSERASKRPLTLAIAGAGGVAQAKWIPAIKRLQTTGEPISLIGIAEPDAASRAKAATVAGTKPFETLAQLLAAEKPDLVLVLTSDDAHASCVEVALGRGVSVLVEKPLAHRFEEALRLVELAKRGDVLLAAVANKRFSPPYAMAKALIDQRRLKSPPTVFTGKFTLGYPYVDLLEAGTVHLIDLMGWFMGPCRDLSARGIIGPDGKLQSAVVSLRFASGAIGSVMTSKSGLSFKPWERVEIFGSGAYLVIDDQLEVTLFDDETGPALSWKPTIPNTLMFDESFGGYAGLLENVLDAIRGLVPLSTPGADGARAVGLIEGIRRALASGAAVDMEREGLLL